MIEISAVVLFVLASMLMFTTTTTVMFYMEFRRENKRLLWEIRMHQRTQEQLAHCRERFAKEIAKK